MKKIPKQLKQDLKLYCLKKIEEGLKFYGNKEYLSFDYDLFDRTQQSKHTDNDKGDTANQTLPFVEILTKLESGELTEEESVVDLINSNFGNDGEPLLAQLNRHLYP